MTSLSAPVENLPPLTYEEALAYWYGRTNYEQRTPQPDDLKLEEMRRLLSALGNPHDNLRILHVAGSKGKGSVSAMLATILHKAGYSTGLFTSPHLIGPEERIAIDGNPITQPELAEAMTDIRRVVVRHGLNPTFFEVATALGFMHFQRRRVQAAVIEVGLGGRLDSTNVCLPEAALITSISFDHTRQLGNTMASIAREKAGIIKPGRPAINGSLLPEACDVIAEVAADRGAPLRQLGRDFHYAYRSARLVPGPESDGRWTGTPGQVQVTTWKTRWPWIELNLLGDHQAANAAVALAAVEILRERGWHIGDRAVVDGLTKVRWPARLEIVGQSPWIILDCAHNTASAQAVASTLKSTFSSARRILVFASSNDKDVPGILRLLTPLFAHACLTRFGVNPRAVPPDELAKCWHEADGGPATCHESAAEAWRHARELAGPEDLVCITGSVFLAGELRPFLGENRGS